MPATKRATACVASSGGGAKREQGKASYKAAVSFTKWVKETDPKHWKHLHKWVAKEEKLAGPNLELTDKEQHAVEPGDQVLTGCSAAASAGRCCAGGARGGTADIHSRAAWPGLPTRRRGGLCAWA